MLAESSSTNHGMVLLYLPLGFLLLVSGRLVESWILGSLGREAQDLDWLSSLQLPAIGGMLLFLRLVVSSSATTAMIAAGAVAAGVVWAVWGLLRSDANKLRSTTPEQVAIMERARAAAWSLVAFHLFILMVLAIPNLL